MRRLRAAGCVFAENEAELLLSAAGSAEELEGMVHRRAGGTPLEVVLGWAEFCGLRVTLDPGVFVPRRRTEFLVQQALALLEDPEPRAPGPHRPAPVIIDLCCGSGAVGLALATALGPVGLHAVDIDPVAVRCAQRNLEPVDGQVYQGDLDEPLPVALRGSVELLVANAPYVPAGEIALMPPEARLHEPATALTAGADGLDVLRRVIQLAPRWLSPTGHLLVEASERQAPLVAQAMARRGLVARLAYSEDWDATVVIGGLRAG